MNFELVHCVGETTNQEKIVDKTFDIASHLNCSLLERRVEMYQYYEYHVRVHTKDGDRHEIRVG